MLTAELTTTALCWRIERRDGVTIALTNHDRDLMIDGVVHRAAPGMTPSAIKRSDGLEADTMDVAGALTSAAISARDLLAGRWDGARVMLFAVDWTGAEGRVELGDRRCRVAMAGRRSFARLIAVDDTALTLDRVEPSANAYGAGLIRWFSGASVGLAAAIYSSDGAVIRLRSAPRIPPAPGYLVQVTQGCDKSIATCAGRFVNAANFRGEPFLPGIDLLTRYPGG